MKFILEDGLEADRLTERLAQSSQALDPQEEGLHRRSPQGWCPLAVPMPLRLIFRHLMSPLTWNVFVLLIMFCDFFLTWHFSGTKQTFLYIISLQNHMRNAFNSTQKFSWILCIATSLLTSSVEFSRSSLWIITNHIIVTYYLLILTAISISFSWL